MPAWIVDTTLRDGLQGCAGGGNPALQLELARRLDASGVDEMELGLAAREADSQVRKLLRVVKRARRVLWCRADLQDVLTAAALNPDGVHISIPGSDRLLRALGRDAAWRLQVLDAVLPLAVQMFPFVSLGVQDAPGTSWDTLEVVLARCQAVGVHRLRLADSAGRWLPQQVADCVARLRVQAGPVILGFHGHNDLGLATANTLLAYQQGAQSLDVTVLGVGERAGNAALEQVVLALAAAGTPSSVRSSALRGLAECTQQCCAEVAFPRQPVVGGACFTHHAGIHQAAMHRDVGCYESFDPALLGTQRVLPVTAHVGRSGLAHALEHQGLQADPSVLERLLPQVRALAARVGRAVGREELRQLLSTGGSHALP